MKIQGEAKKKCLSRSDRTIVWGAIFAMKMGKNAQNNKYNSYIGIFAGILGLLFFFDLTVPAANAALQAPFMRHGHRAHEIR